MTLSFLSGETDASVDRSPPEPTERPTVDDRSVPLRSRILDFVRNGAILVGLWFAYAAVRSLTSDQLSTAVWNARQVIEFQEFLGLPSEVKIQSLVLGYPGLVRLANSFYMWVHFPLTGAFVAWALIRHRSMFPVIREALVFLTGAAMILHVVFPLAPPRFMPGFFDTGAIFGPSPYDISASSAANAIAAMPSLHVGWALIIAISIVTLSNNRWRFLAFAHPIVTSLVVVVTANHYWIDAFVAVLLVIGAWEFSARLAHQQLLKSPWRQTETVSS